jgi:DNA-binding transcriptional regulator YhcF (GntR family)
MRESDVPVGAQLARALREWIAGGLLAGGDRLPSVRELAAEAGVNVNTARAVYQRLEHEGLVRSEHGRGTFVARPGSGGSDTRDRLRRQIAALEHELAQRSPSPSDPFAPTPRQPARLMSADELRGVRDGLLERLRRLDATRAEILERLAELERHEQAELAADEADLAKDAAESAAPRRSTLSVPGARVRWVGA